MRRRARPDPGKSRARPDIVRDLCTSAASAEFVPQVTDLNQVGADAGDGAPPGASTLITLLRGSTPKGLPPSTVERARASSRCSEPHNNAVSSMQERGGFLTAPVVRSAANTVVEVADTGNRHRAEHRRPYLRAVLHDQARGQGTSRTFREAGNRGEHGGNDRSKELGVGSTSR